MNDADKGAERQPAARAGQVSPAFIDLIEQYGASPRLLRRVRSVMSDHPRRLSPPGTGDSMAPESAEAPVPEDTVPRRRDSGDPAVTGFAGLLRGFRLSAGFSQEELARRAGFSVDAVVALERGRRRAPRTGTLFKLADALLLGSEERVQLIAAARGETRASRRPKPPPAHGVEEGARGEAEARDVKVNVLVAGGILLGAPVDSLDNEIVMQASEDREFREDVVPAPGLSVPDLDLVYVNGGWIFVEAK